MSKTILDKKERAALAMHELMKREQRRYADRINEQNQIALMSDESLKALVEDMPLPDHPNPNNTKENDSHGKPS